MRLNFTKKQYNTLLEICLLGVYVIEKSKLEVDDKYNEMLKYIMEFNENLSFMENKDILDEITNLASVLINNIDLKDDFLEQYNERIFWKELSKRLAARDALEEIGEDLNSEKYNEYVKIKNKYEEKYNEKFNIDKFKNIKLPY